GDPGDEGGADLRAPDLPDRQRAHPVPAERGAAPPPGRALRRLRAREGRAPHPGGTGGADPRDPRARRLLHARAANGRPSLTMPVPFVDLLAQYRAIQREVDAAIAEVLATSEFVLGPRVEAFERGFAASCGVKHAVGVGSGTAALMLLLQAHGIGAD